jgi:hypothetical protein
VTKSAFIVSLLVFSLILNFQGVDADIRSEGGVLNEKGIQWCEEEQPRYEIMGLELYLKNNHYSLEARVCGNLLEDDLWNYQGPDRVQKLIERSKFYSLAEMEESKQEALGANDPTPTDVDPSIFALEQWRSGEITEEELEQKLKEIGWSLSKIEEVKESKPISQEELMKVEEDFDDLEIQEEEIPTSETPPGGGGCLIATATFGTEFSPQVQQLREIRDGTVLKTNSGTFFLNGFNQFYYSFSPTIADIERQSPIFKEFVKITITPMLTTLSLLNYVNIDSEIEMLGFGLGILFLNVGFYFTIPIVAVIKLKRNLLG